jgi:hypothetical protein
MYDRERSPELDMLARRMRSATGKRKTTGETMHASPSDDPPRQPLPPPHPGLRDVSLTPGPRTPYPRKTNLQVDLSCLAAFDGGPVSPGEEGGSQFVPSPTAKPSTCSSDAERVATPTSVSSAAPPVYPIFKAQTKTVYLIRHGESEYNAADAYYSKSFEEPSIFDAPLTHKGSMQVRPTTASHSAALAIPGKAGCDFRPIASRAQLIGGCRKQRRASNSHRWARHCAGAWTGPGTARSAGE